MNFKPKPKEPVSRPNRQMMRRTLFLMTVCGFFAFALLTGRLYRLQIADREFYEKRAAEQQLRSVSSSACRGSIFDRNMNPLALSRSAESLYLSPAEIKAGGEDRALIARGVSEILKLSYEDIYEKTADSSSYYVSVKRKLSADEAEALRHFKNENNLRGLRLEPDSRRVYPNSSLCCHVLGFVGDDNQGLEGIEAQYDEYLRGSPGRTTRITNARGTDLLFTQLEEHYPGSEGLSLVLSIDSGIQYFTEKHLRQAVRDYDIQNGAGAIVMNVNTGEILAMASLGDYDPNDFLRVEPKVPDEASLSGEKEEEADLKEQQQLQWRNKALCDSYEPGSTFKIITLSMALEEGAASMDSTYYCPGSISVKGRTEPIRCWKSGGHGSQSLTQAVQHSCNAAFVNIGLQLGAEKFYDYCEAFGFLNKTGDPDESLSGSSGFDLKGETGGIWWSENVFCSEKNLSQLAAASFGQTFTISPLQLISAVSACVNGGRLMRPYVVKEMLRADGSCAFRREPETVRSVISEETSEKVRTILEQVVGDPKEGTGRNAAVAGYRIGGKTGTSEKVSLQVSTGRKEYIVSFIGFAPADKPEIALLVFLDTPSDKSGVYVSGGQMAAPVVGRMLADILPYMGFEPSYADSEESIAPELLGMSREEALRSVKNAGLACSISGSGNTVTDQLPKAGCTLASGSGMLLNMGGSFTGGSAAVPELRGMDYAAARDLLAEKGIFVRSLSPLAEAGAQKISGQSVPAGAELPIGSVIELMLRDSDEQLLGKY